MPRLYALQTCMFFIAILGSSCFGAAFMFDQFVIVNAGLDNYYDIGAATGNPDFQGQNLGTFTNTDSVLLGGVGKSGVNDGTAVNGMQLFYRVYSGSQFGDFNNFDYAFQTDLGGGDQVWGSNVAGTYTPNLITGLANGNYTLQVYTQITTNGVNASPTVLNHNGGSYYTASFTVTPEPGRTSLLLLGLLCTMICRRR